MHNSIIMKAVVMLLSMCLIFASLTGCGSSDSGNQPSNTSSNNNSQTSDSDSNNNQASDSGSNENNQTSEPSTDDSTQASDSGMTDAADNDIIDVTFFQPYAVGKPAPETSPITQELAKRTGVNVLMNMQLNAGNTDQVNIFAASNGDFPDIVSSDSSGGVIEIVNEMGAAGMVWDIKPYLDDYPNFAAIVRATSELYETPDGHLYMYPTWTNATATFVDTSFYLARKDLYNSLGRSAFPKNPDEFIEMLRVVKDTVKGDDGNPIIPLTGFGQSLDYFSLIFLAESAHGFYSPDHNNPNTNVTRPLNQDKELVMKVCKFINLLYKENLMDKEFYTNSKEQAQEKIASGNVFACAGFNLRDMFSSNDLLKSENPDKYFVMTPIPFDPSNTNPVWKGDWPFGYCVNYINKKTIDENKLKKILGMLDYSSTVDGYVLNWFGREGYEAVRLEDGSWDFSDEIKAKTNGGSMPDLEAEGCVWLTGLMYTNTLAEAASSVPIYFLREDGIESAMNMYGGTEQKDIAALSPIHNKFYDAFATGPIYNEKNAYFKDLQDALTIAVINAGSDAEIEGLVDKYLDDCKKAGIDEIVAERVEQIRIKYNLN